MLRVIFNDEYGLSEVVFGCWCRALRSVYTSVYLAETSGQNLIPPPSVCHYRWNIGRPQNTQPCRRLWSFSAGANVEWATATRPSRYVETASLDIRSI